MASIVQAAHATQFWRAGKSLPGELTDDAPVWSQYALGAYGKQSCELWTWYMLFTCIVLATQVLVQ